MKIENIFEEFNAIESRLREKAEKARATAATARRLGNMKKWDKFNAVARVYEALLEQIGPLVGEILYHTPESYQDGRPIPF